MKFYQNGKWQIILFAILLFLVPNQSMGADPGARPEKIVVGYMMVPNPLIITKELSWIEKALDIPVEWVQFESGRHVQKKGGPGTHRFHTLRRRYSQWAAHRSGLGYGGHYRWRSPGGT